MTAGAIPTGLRLPLVARVSGAGWAARLTAMGGFALLLLVLPLASDPLALDALTGAEYALVGIGLNVLVGYTGQLSLGQFAFVALGAVTARKHHQQRQRTRPSRSPSVSGSPLRWPSVSERHCCSVPWRCVCPVSTSRS